MSWFDDLDLDPIEDLGGDDCCEEVADGVVIERRRLLWVSAATAGAFLLGGGSRAIAQDKVAAAEPGKTKSLAAFLDEALPMARELVAATKRNENAYLFRVASMLAEVKAPTEDVRKTMRAFREKNKREGEARFPLAVMELRVKPGGRLPHHDHRNYNGVIVGVEGEIRIRNYDIIGRDDLPPEGETFQIRETQDTLVRPGQYSMLASNRNNIHDLQGGEKGGRVLDVFTFFDKGARSAYMDVEDKPRDAERRIYDAAWKPRRRRRGGK